jgi:hypothetical protein
MSWKLGYKEKCVIMISFYNLLKLTFLHLCKENYKLSFLFSGIRYSDLIIPDIFADSETSLCHTLPECVICP